MIVLLILLCSVFAGVQAEEKVSVPSVVKETQVIQGNQKLRIADNVDIERMSLKKIIAYMMWSPSLKVVDTFEHMPLEAKLNFLKGLSIYQYGWFLFKISDQQWQTMWQRLSPEERAIIPETKLEQLKMIRDTWLECSSGDIYYYYENGSKDAQAKDLPLYRDKALRRIKSFKTDNVYINTVDERMPIFYKWLDNRFYGKKLRLLKALG